MPPLSETALADEFQRNVEAIAAELIRAYSLKFKQEVANLSNPLLRWLDFRYRYVDPQPRQVVFSKKFPKHNLPVSAKIALKKIVRLIRKGGDINPYQGRGLILRNDISGERNDARTDLLWADWGIHHFHLSDAPIPTTQYFSRPADYLAFCLVGGNLVAFIDVLPHSDKESFASPDLLNTIAKTWPHYINQYRLNGVLPSGKHTGAEIHTLRSNGVTPILNINGVAYMSPEKGITSASTPMKVTIAYDHLRKYVRDLAAMVYGPNGQFRTPEIDALEIAPEFFLASTPSGLSVYEANSRHAFLLPCPQPNQAGSFLETLHDLVLPRWACKLLVARSEKFPA